jgi:hypothetical protein
MSCLFCMKERTWHNCVLKCLPRVVSFADIIRVFAEDNLCYDYSRVCVCVQSFVRKGMFGGHSRLD